MKKIYLIIYLIFGSFAISNGFGQSVEALFIVGNATPIGWDITKAIEMTKVGTIFTYEGNLAPGEFKFPVNRNSDWGQDIYERDPENDPYAYLHIGGQPDDNKWTIKEAGNYKVTIDVASLEVTIVLNFDPSSVPAELYMIGDATSNGWSIDKADQLTKSGNTFVWDGALKVGNFKFPVNKNADFNQNMYMRDSEHDSIFYKHVGGAGDDSQWTAFEEGWYHIELNFATSTIKIQLIQIYMVGSATSIGWDIGIALPFTQDFDSLFMFSYSGDMVPGELKFPINQQTDWGQDMYMKNPLDTTKMYYHTGGATDDSKWKIGEAGSYTIKLDLKHFTIKILNNAYAGIKLENTSNQIRLLSNMVDEKLVVINSNQFNYQVYSINGSLLKRGSSTNGIINVDDLKTGIYMLRLNDQKGSSSSVKFLKK